MVVGTAKRASVMRVTTWPDVSDGVHAEHGDPVQLVLHDVQRLPVEQEAVAVRDALPPSDDLGRRTRRRIGRGRACPVLV